MWTLCLEGKEGGEEGGGKGRGERRKGGGGE